VSFVGVLLVGGKKKETRKKKETKKKKKKKKKKKNGPFFISPYKEYWNASVKRKAFAQTRAILHTHSHTTSREKEEDHHHQQQQQQQHAPRRAVERHRSEVRTHGARDAPVSEENERRARGEGGVHGSVFTKEEEGGREERNQFHHRE